MHICNWGPLKSYHSSLCFLPCQYEDGLPTTSTVTTGIYIYLPSGGSFEQGSQHQECVLSVRVQTVCDDCQECVLSVRVQTVCDDCQECVLSVRVLTVCDDCQECVRLYKV